MSSRLALLSLLSLLITDKQGDAVAPEVASMELMSTVLSWLADYRAEHPEPAGR